MVDYILSLIILILLGFIYLKDKEHTKQINQLIKAVIAKHPQDVINMDLAEKTQVLANKPDPTEPTHFTNGPLGPLDDDLVPMDGDPDLFDRFIEKSLNGDKEEELDESNSGE